MITLEWLQTRKDELEQRRRQLMSAFDQTIGALALIDEAIERHNTLEEEDGNDE